MSLAGSPDVITRPLLACYGLSGVVHLASTALGTVLPFHVVALGGSRTQVGVLFSATTVMSMLFRPAVGGWIDRFGARVVILPGLAIVLGASLALHLPGEPEPLIAVMIGAGIGFGLVSMATSVLTVRAAGADHRGEALSLYYLASSLAVAVAPPLGLGLRGLGGVPLAFATVSGLAVAMLALALSLPPSVTAPVAAAPPGLRLLSRRTIPVACALVFTTVGHSSVYAFLPLYAESRGHGGLVVWFFAIYSVCLIVCRALLGRLSDRIGRARVALPAMTLTALGYFMLVPPPTTASLMAAAMLLGGGNSLLYPTLAALVVDQAPEGERGLALGTLSGAWDLGIVLGSTLIGMVADRASFGSGFAVAGAATAAGALAFVLTERRQRRVAAS